MRFGDLPTWAEKLGSGIHQAAVHFAGSVPVETPDSETPLPPDLLWREPPFDQMIVNSYQPGEVSVRVAFGRPTFAIERPQAVHSVCSSFSSFDCLPVPASGNKRPAMLFDNAPLLLLRSRSGLHCRIIVLVFLSEPLVVKYCQSLWPCFWTPSLCS